MISCSHARQIEKKTAETVIAINIYLILSQSIKIRTGQYINLWISSVDSWSWAQNYLFMIIFWSHEKQDTLNLLLQSRESADIVVVHQTCAIESDFILFLIFFINPHGISQPVDQYEIILVIASKFDIAVIIPYLQNMIYGYNTCTSHIRWLYFLWQVESLDEQASPRESYKQLTCQISQMRQKSYSILFWIMIFLTITMFVPHSRSRERIANWQSHLDSHHIHLYHRMIYEAG